MIIKFIKKLLGISDVENQQKLIIHTLEQILLHLNELEETKSEK